MNKLRILADNYVLDAGAVVNTYMYKIQRLYTIAMPFVPGDVLTTGATVINTGSVTTPVSGASFFMDVLLVSDANMMVPNPANQTPTVVTDGGLKSTTANVGYRVIPNATGFLPDNLLDENRNRVVRSINNLENYQFTYNRLSISITLDATRAGSIVNSLFLINHNLTPTATITVNYVDAAGTVLLTEALTNPVLDMFDTNSDYFKKTGSTQLTTTDREGPYFNKQIFRHYLTTGLLNVATIQLDIEDVNNTSALNVGLVYVGKFYEVDKNMKDSWSIDINDMSVTSYAQSPYSTERPSFDVLTLLFDNVGLVDKQFWLDLYKQNGTFKDVIYDLFNGSTTNSDNYNIIYGRFMSNKFRIINRFLDRYSIRAIIRESI